LRKLEVGVYRHFKGSEYQVLCKALHTENGEELVIYRNACKDTDDEIYARPLNMFLSEVDRDKYPGVKQKYRFEKID